MTTPIWLIVPIVYYLFSWRYTFRWMEFDSGRLDNTEFGLSLVLSGLIGWLAMPFIACCGGIDWVGIIFEKFFAGIGWAFRKLFLWK